MSKFTIKLYLVLTKTNLPLLKFVLFPKIFIERFFIAIALQIFSDDGMRLLVCLYN
jgi:hypothetical protein